MNDVHGPHKFRQVVAPYQDLLNTGADSNPFAGQVELEVLIKTHLFTKTIRPLALLHLDIVNPIDDRDCGSGGFGPVLVNNGLRSAQD